MHARRSARATPAVVIEGEVLVAGRGAQTPAPRRPQAGPLPQNDNRPVPDAVFLGRRHGPDLLFQGAAHARARAPEAQPTQFARFAAGLQHEAGRRGAAAALLMGLLATLAAGPGPTLPQAGRAAVSNSTQGPPSATTNRMAPSPVSGKTDRITVSR